MTPKNYKEAILAAIPLVRESWWQSMEVRGFTSAARGKFCPIIAVSSDNLWGGDYITPGKKEIVDEAIHFMSKAAGEPIAQFNDRVENVEQVIAVMEKAAE